MQERVRTARDERLTYALAACIGARFGLGIWVLYYLLFTDYRGIGVVESLMMATALTAELPTGALADLLGRRRTLQAAFLFGGGGYVLLAQTQGLAMLCLSVVVLTLSWSLVSGTYEALVFDVVQARGRVPDYVRTLAGTQAVRLAVLACTSAAGGYLYTLAPAAPFYASAATFGIGLVVASFLSAPYGTVRPFGWRLWLRQTRRGMERLARPVRARGALAFVLATGLLYVVAEEMLDDVLAVAFGFGPRQLGWLFAGVFLCAALASRLTAGLVARIPQGRLLLGLALVTGATLAVSPWLGLWLGGLTVATRYAARAVLANVEADLVNRYTATEDRATTLSTFFLLKRFPYIAGATAVGVLMDRWSPTAFAAVLGAALLAVAVLTARWAGRADDGDGGQSSPLR